MLNLNSFNSSSSSSDVDYVSLEAKVDEEIKNNTPIEKEKLLDFYIQNRYEPPKRNNWTDFILNSLYYIVLVLIVGVIGANLNTLGTLGTKALKNNQELENKLRKIFPHTQFADDDLRIDNSVDRYPLTIDTEQETKEFNYTPWCSACDLSVQLRLLFVDWPIKIIDGSNYLMYKCFLSFIKTYLTSSGPLKYFIIPILSIFIIFLQIPIIISFGAALYYSSRHPHWPAYWIGLIVSYKFISKYVKTFLKFISRFKSSITRTNVRGHGRWLKIAYDAKIEDDTDWVNVSDTAPDWAVYGQNVTIIVDYLFKNNENASSYVYDPNEKDEQVRRNAIEGKIRTSIELKYPKKHANKQIAAARGVLDLFIEELDTYFFVNGEQTADATKDPKFIDFRIELWVFEHMTVPLSVLRGQGNDKDYEGREFNVAYTIIGELNLDLESMDFKRGKNKLIYLDDVYNTDSNARNSFLNVELNIIKDLLDYFADFGKQVYQTSKGDGMLSWKEWQVDTGRGSIKDIDSKEGGDYYNYKVNWKRNFKALKKKKMDDAAANQRKATRDAWYVLIVIVIMRTIYYIFEYIKAVRDIALNKSNNMPKNSNNEPHGGGGGGNPKGVLGRVGRVGRVDRVSRDEIKRLNQNSDIRLPPVRRSHTSTLDSRLDRNRRLQDLIPRLGRMSSLVVYAGEWTLGSLLWITEKVTGYFANNTRASTALEILRLCIELSKIIVLYFIFGWWVTPIYGIVICTLYSLLTQLKVISLLLFGSTNKKTYISENRYGLTIMGLLMLSYSAITSLMPNVALGVSIALLVCSIIIISCLKI